MTELAVFSSGSSFYDVFQPQNCLKNGGCWNDRDEDCPIISDLFTHGQSPRVVNTNSGCPQCLDYQTMAEGLAAKNLADQRETRQKLLEQHGGGLFPELAYPEGT